MDHCLGISICSNIQLPGDDIYAHLAATVHCGVFPAVLDLRQGMGLFVCWARKAMPVNCALCWRALLFELSHQPSWLVVLIFRVGIECGSEIWRRSPGCLMKGAYIAVTGQIGTKR